MSVRKGIVLIAAGLMAAAAGFSGCQDTAKNSVQVRQPAVTPRPASHASVVVNVGELPLPASLPDLSDLQPQPRPWVDALIERVQGIFDAATQAYQAGQLDVARKDFNQAIHELTKNNLEATGDVRLQQLFNRIVDTMQTDEMATEAKDEATAEANEDAADNAADNADNGDNASADNSNSTTDNSDDTTAQAPPQSTAPIEEIAELEDLPASDPKLAALAEKELITVPHDLPLTLNASVLQYLSYFASPRGRDIVEMGLQRAGRYRAMIESTLKKEGLPLDLFYLAQAESAFKPRAVSSKGARGIWQFMPYTGQEYGLHRTYYVDQRDNPAEATEAAAESLRDLYQSFGDWYLVMAAYNSGPMNVTRAVERTGYADFWQLQKMNALPEQTKNYVPIILALALVAKDPGLYGIQVDPDPDPGFDSVTMEHSTSLRLVADATGASLDDLQAMNPELIRGITPPEFALNVPKGTGDKLKTEIASIPADKLTSWRLSTFKSGETLGEVARQYHVTLASLENVNMIDAHDPPAEGTVLIVPAAPPRLRRVYYRVKAADTLDSIAARYEVTVSDLRSWNHLKSSRAPHGRTLRIYENYYPAESVGETRVAAKRPVGHTEAVAETSGAHAKVEHKVRSGETLWSIAHEYGTTVDAIKQENPFLASRGLEVGDRLNITPR
ncbi:MAG TPA: LysM peptidoglycan-binding domain-containing protein [Candidatus Acidoferrales bacterium]|nr:LysM peptidoglycan-binding domain-containing protein [Candidatus Acidoferrales bacterium]